ncbi:hypothetical protein [Massilia sp. TS11]|uniref:hypothetical protein n=1 Tax=Massilia sp. TS11 TaxID=2908003 RepID=UPI001EDB7097|nr:hypothetical protein [Massilia sp. TS11]MCG2582844.1 hypothetical protein [Massilia sp. TS11]
MEIKNSVVALKPGIFILRHPADSAVPISISRAPGGRGNIQALWTDGTQGAILRNGADCIVMHIKDAEVHLLVSAFVEAGQPAPALRIDEIGLDDGAAAALPAAEADVLEIPPQGLSLVGHIERRGDCVAAPGATLGDPASAARLEGFQLEWPDKPKSIDLTYSAVIEDHGPTALMKCGDFCGTRGEARRLTEVSFSLIGKDAAKFELTGNAYFSGGFTVPVMSGMPLSGPSGLEHLVALELGTRIALPKAANPWKSDSRTKVFKSKPGSKAK